MTTSTTSTTTTTTRPIEVERASAEDAGPIARLLRRNAEVPTLLLQRPATILRHIDEFVVIRGPAGSMVGCAQLHWHQPRVAELMAVAVDPERHGEGLGRVVVRACLERVMRHDPAPTLVWLATRTPGFFARLGFRRIPMWQVPPTVLLGKLGLALRQPPRRWLGTMFGGAVFMRWAGAW